ncbi:MAG: alpha/beta hydrolase [Balneolaceae bacterium]|nr:alpha/beta hydrolase [Balneolaceae bacterium]
MKRLASLLSIFITLILCISTQAQISDSYPYPVNEITVKDSVSIAYMDTKVGNETIILIHGLGSYGPAWTHNIEALSERYRVIVPDLPGYGMSSKNLQPVSLISFAEAISELINHLEIEKVTLAGHSMGGQIAMTLALENPSLVEKLVLVAPAGIETFNAQQATMLKSFVTPASVCNTSQEQSLANYRLNFYQMPESALFMIEDRFAMEKRKDFEQYCASVSGSVAAMLDEPVYDRLAEITQPTLIIFGENDALIPNKYLNPTLTTQQIAKTAEEMIQNSRSILFENAGHFVQFEKPAATNKAILEFLN